MRFARTLLVLTCSLSIAASAAAQTAPRRSFETLRSREQALTSATPAPSVTRLRKQVAEWDAFVRRYPVSGYADDALWAAAELSSAISERTQADADRQRAAKYYRWLAREYPASDKVKAALARASALDQPETPAAVATRTPVAPKALAGDVSALPRPTATRGVLPPAPASDTTTRVSPNSPPVPGDAAASAMPVVKPAMTSGPRLKDIRRTVLPELVRVTIELDDEAAFTHERIDGPARVFFDVKAAAVPALQDRVLSFADDVVRQVRVGRRPAQSTRVVLDLEGVSRYSVFTLYTPFRIVVDLERTRGARAVRPDVTSPTLIEQWADTAPAGSAPAASAAPVRTASPSQADLDATVPAAVDAIPAPPSATLPRFEPLPPVASSEGPAGRATDVAQAIDRRPASPAVPKPAPQVPAAVAPTAPAANAAGGFSLARQLGLGVSRIVIDPGHGGHDPGALGKRVTEAELVLDVALRLEKLLHKAGIDVVMTRRTDVFIPLEERTAIANREGADLFLSIHANASRNVKAHGVETYFLNFASNPEAEAVAARENSASAQSMHTLPDIVRAIALNNKLDESRDFARLVQDSMIRKLRTQNKAVRDLGVKQAPFVVLIGAGMPSVLAEIAFVTHPQEGQLLRTNGYRQHVADALFEAVARYIKSLKTVGTVALQD